MAETLLFQHLLWYYSRRYQDPGNGLLGPGEISILVRLKPTTNCRSYSVLRSRIVLRL